MTDTGDTAAPRPHRAIDYSNVWLAAWTAARKAERDAQVAQVDLLRECVAGIGGADLAADLTGLSRSTVFRRLAAS